jgi:hypothetical protein
MIGGSVAPRESGLDSRLRNATRTSAAIPSLHKATLAVGSSAPSVFSSTACGRFAALTATTGGSSGDGRQY